MPKPREINTDKREDQLIDIRNVLFRQCDKLDTIIEDLSKPHVDDKKAARSLLSSAKKMRKRIYPV